VQSDVLEYIRDISDDHELKAIAAKLAAVYPLYREEVHILGDLSLKTLQDLDGKRVAIGPERSGTYLTAKTIFFQTGIKPSQEVFLGGKQALESLRKGEIDAMFYVAGAPATLFRRIQQSMTSSSSLGWTTKPSTAISLQSSRRAHTNGRKPT
jgi:uncharacterized protein